MFQRLRYAGWLAEQDRVLREILGLDLLQPVDHVDKISVTWRCRFWVTGQSRDCALSVVAYLTRTLRILLLFRVGKVREVAAHQPAGRFAVPGASFMIEVGD